jgi:CheY-like chemotaxis protein
MKLPDNGKTILVIEDEPLINRVCVKILKSEGYQVELALNGKIGIEMANRKQYDLYFSDIRTPEMNGIQFYEHLKQKDPVQAEKVIFTTGDTLSTEIKKFLKANNNLFLSKPFTPNELRKVVSEAIARQEQTVEVG